MRLWEHARLRRGAIMLGGLAALGATALPLSGSAAASSVYAPLPHIHMMPTLNPETAHDCVLPVVISVECAGVGLPMSSGGGAVQTSPAVYIVFWGWHGNDPAGMGTYQQAFFNGVGGSAWAGTQTQYCENTTLLGLRCGSGPFAGNPSGVLKGTWADETNPVPTNPDDAAIQAEAVRAAAHFNNTTPASNASTQYIIDTPPGNSTVGFITQWCAYHGMASSSAGGLSYTDFPYIPDAGGTCGQDFVNSGSAGNLDGVSIVGGHEYAESVTDPDPPNGWTDSIGAETGDKCAWISFGPGASTDITLSTGTFAVQSLWSNSANAGARAAASPTSQSPGPVGGVQPPAGLTLALRWKRFSGSHSALTRCRRWYFCGP